MAGMMELLTAGLRQRHLHNLLTQAEALQDPGVREYIRAQGTANPRLLSAFGLSPASSMPEPGIEGPPAPPLEQRERDVRPGDPAGLPPRTLGSLADEQSSILDYYSSLNRGLGGGGRATSGAVSYIPKEEAGGTFGISGGNRIYTAPDGTIRVLGAAPRGSRGGSGGRGTLRTPKPTAINDGGGILFNTEAEARDYAKDSRGRATPSLRYPDKWRVVGGQGTGNAGDDQANAQADVEDLISTIAEQGSPITALQRKRLETALRRAGIELPIDSFLDQDQIPSLELLNQGLERAQRRLRATESLLR